MASSNNSITENKKTKNAETSTPTSKTKKHINIEKSKEKKNKKKLKLTNGNSKEQHEDNQKRDLDNNEEEGEGEEAKTHVFPMNRIKTILKSEISDLRLSQEAILAVNNAAKKFLEQLAEEAYVYTAQDRKKYLSYNHLSHVVSKQRRYDFLSDFVPEKVKAEDALRETNSRAKTGG